MNPSSTSFDQALKEIAHYTSFPAMLPFVGSDYISANHSKLLILGESFYLPRESTLHKDPVQWYSSNQSLLGITEDERETEVDWINCRRLLECVWNNGGHRIYREINGCLDEMNLPYSDRPVSNICYTNTFMRPATTEGGSFFKCCVPQDFAMSIEVLAKVISILTPDLVIFASKGAWDSVGKIVAEQVSGTSFDFVSHPADPRHWNVESYEHGRKKFISLLKKWAMNVQ